MTGAELTEAMISAAIRKADARVCIANDRCYAFPDPLFEVGWIVRASGRDSWDVWVEVRTGLVKLIQRANA